MTATYAAAHAAALATFADGGGTFDAAALAPVKPESGYAVSLAGGWSSPHVARDESVATLTAAILTAAARAAQRVGRTFVGTWISDDDGRVYVDETIILADHTVATQAGYRNRQKAIWSFADGEAIPL